ncbi:amidase [Mongoliimonas terrestris]|uniref:amidase n=1 Tax=Mongoliimonas terrestris TaxID=1709001 RepID=UPI0009495457|nr:amidase [Mongoliimonas terrestris]
MNDVASWTLTEVATALRDRTVSSVELTSALLDRIAAWNGVVNAFVAVEAETALAAAKAADAARAAGQPIGPLAGIPLAHKDMYDRAGVVTGCGSRIRAGHVATETATVMARLEAAGALHLGRLNMSEFALGPTGLNAHHGRACNPWDPAVVTGGSSSGSGAAVAAGLAYGALGSDTGGSIRLPSAICGIAGLKPTQGRVSRHGVMPLSFSQDCVGPMAPTVEDVALLYGVIAGADPKDPTASTRPVTVPKVRSRLDGVRIGLSDWTGADFDGLTASAHADARRILEGLGATVVSVEMPDPMALGELSNVVAMTEAAAIHMDWLSTRPEDYGDQVRARLRQGLTVPAALYLRAIQMRTVLVGRIVEEVFGRCDVVMLPVLPFVPPTSAEMDGDPAGGAAVPRMVAVMARFTRPISYLGLPGLSVPIGRSHGNLPIGMQLVGRPFDEAGILSVGMAFERAAGSKRLLPALPA